jgi:hypothetical protein
VNSLRDRGADVKKPMISALAIVVACSVWLFAEKREAAPGMYLVTSFDFARYPVCQSSGGSNCILAIRFYDADSNQRLAEVETNARMRGTQRIMAKANAGAMPHRAYAVTLYLDSDGSRKEGPRGQTTALRAPSYGNSTGVGENAKGSR